MMKPSTRRELLKLRELVHFLLQGAGSTPRHADTFGNYECAPFACCFCRQAFEHAGQDFAHGNSVGPKLLERITIHHVDGNHSNDSPSNKSLCHTSCHKAHHRRLANELRAASKREAFS